MEESVIKAGAYHARAWAGLVVSDEPGHGAAFRFLVSRRGERADWRDVTSLLHEIGPCAPDGSYARLGFDTKRPFTRTPEELPVSVAGGRATFTLEWSRTGEDRLVACVQADFPGVFELRGYFPWDWAGAWSIDRSDLVAQWGPRPNGILVQVLHRPALRRSERGRAILDSSGDAGIRFNVDLGSRVYVACTRIVDEPDPLRTAPSIDEIDDAIAAARDSYQTRRTATTGGWAGLAESVANSSHWNVLLQPDTGERYTPAGREWIFPTAGGDREHWMTFGWDSFLNPLALAIESPTLAESSTRVVLETQYPSGNIPNWRGRTGGTPDRSQPPIGSYTVLKQYLRTGNREMLEWALPYLQRWNAWWYAPKGELRRRDGNANGLFNWGCDLSLQTPGAPAWERDLPPLKYASWESAQPDLPHWNQAAWSDEAETMDLDAVDLNSYLALDFECLAMIAREIGDSDREIRYLEQYRALKKRIDDTLWDDETGVYRDRHWDGRRSPHLGAVNFLPLLAGIPSLDRAERMVRILTDPRQFWGRYVIPTTSRSDTGGGSIHAIMNYLVYQGLRRYELDRVAGELAHRSVDMFLANWNRFQTTPARFSARDGSGRGKPHPGSGALLGLLGIEQFIDVTPWEGMRIGSPVVDDESTIRRVQLFGQRWTVAMAEDGIEVAANDVNILRTDAPIVLRDIIFDRAGLQARTSAERETTITLATMDGPMQCEIDGDATTLTEPRLTLPAGSHRFRVWTTD